MKHKIPDTIFGKSVEGAIKRALATNTDSENTVTNQPQRVDANFSDNVAESFIMSYDHPQYGQFFQELIRKSNEKFKGTRAEISAGTSGEIQGHLIKRMGLITTLYNNPALASANLWPITPTQSEALFKDGKLTNPESNWEDLGFILYDLNGSNSREAQAFYISLKNHAQSLGLNQGDLENKLVVVNAGIDLDNGSDYGIKPIVLPGLTQVYTHETLSKTGEGKVGFNGYGLNGGLPLLNQLGSGSRTLWMPEEKENIGLRVLCRGRDLSLGARGRNLANSNEDGRVNFARSASS